jgi:hypothetical protein
VFVPPFLIAFTILLTLFAIQHNKLEREQAAMQAEDAFEVTNQLPPQTPNTNPPKPIDLSDGVVCTMDVRECPDGTFVSRTGPDCAFAACPNEVPPGEDVVTPPDQDRVTYCPDDARICADGTVVSRSGPQCEFDPCPDEIGESEIVEVN